MSFILIDSDVHYCLPGGATTKFLGGSNDRRYTSDL